MISYCDIQRDSRNDPRSQGICPGRSVAKGSSARCIPAPMYVGDAGAPPAPWRQTIKFHFCRANVFELAIKQWFSSPCNVQRGRAAALASSRFLFTHQRTGFAVYTLRSHSLAPTPYWSTSSKSSSSSTGPSHGAGKVRLFRGTQIRRVRERGILERWAPAARSQHHCHQQKSFSTFSKPGRFLLMEKLKWR